MPDFIFVEGPDGSGKTTTASAIADALRARGFKVAEERQPHSKHIRAFLSGGEDGLPATSPEARTLAFITDRVEQISRLAKADVDYVVMDRSVVSTIVNQMDTVPWPWLLQVCAVGEAAIPRRSRVFYLHLDPSEEQLRERLEKRRLFAPASELPDPPLAEILKHKRLYDDVFYSDDYSDFHEGVWRHTPDDVLYIGAAADEGVVPNAEWCVDQVLGYDSRDCECDQEAQP